VPTAVAFVVTVALTPLVLTYLRRGQRFDVPNERSSHAAPTPRGGGLAVAVGASVGALVATSLPSATRTGLLAAALVFGVIGLIDDLRPTPALVRLAAQFAAASAALPWLLHAMHGSALWKLTFFAGCALWITAYVNAFNFMDGINGISACHAIAAGAAWAIVANLNNTPSLATVGALIGAACLAFLPFNFPSARVFLGDVGSYFIGAWMAVAVIVGLRGGLPFEAAIAPVAVYLVDTSTTIVRRVRAGETWHAPHRSHVYQRLHQQGWSHARTTLVVTGFTLVCAALGAVSLTGALVARVSADVAAAMLLVAYVRSPGLRRAVTVASRGATS
jgi:UDP-N-acetylmuramyl pentapeptide phosphotransferase/UDP-N-acetylglucosamine-1-phosphate transferase